MEWVKAEGGGKVKAGAAETDILWGAMWAHACAPVVGIVNPTNAASPASSASARNAGQ